MKRVSVILISVLCLVATGGSARAELVVNEVLADEPGSDVLLEWVELV
ncbi:hypothetical protein GF377_00060, partial [candidate division GN15 bacterium]|nr:hypothetical protein [candidate division GN15 bacterium]